MRLVLGLDFETEVVEPFDPKQMRIIEIGAVLWDVERHYPVLPITRLVWSSQHTFSPKITDITGLTLADLETYGTPPAYALEKLSRLMCKVEAVVAHNGAGFDKIVLEAESARHDIWFPPTPWVDTLTDLPYPARIETRKLEFLAPSHGFLNPFSHRAMFDAMAMMKIMAHYNWDEVLATSKIPNVRVRAVINKPFGKTEEIGKREVEQAKARGYRFEKADGEGLWIKRMKENQVAAEVAAAPWRVVTLKDL